MAGSDFFSLEFDTRAFFAALDEIKVEAQQVLDVEAHAAADFIADEARRRVLRATGQTAEGIVVIESSDGQGYVVEATEPNPRPANIPLWLDKGTYKMTARPFFDVSVDLERAAHQRRMQEAVQDGIDDAGLGQ